MWTRLEQSQQCQVQPEWRGGFGGWSCQKRRRLVEENTDRWAGQSSGGKRGLIHCEQGHLSGVSSPEAWVIGVKEVVLWKTEGQQVVDSAFQGFREEWKKRYNNWIMETFDLLVALQEKSVDHKSEYDSSYGHHEYLNHLLACIYALSSCQSYLLCQLHGSKYGISGRWESVGQSFLVQLVYKFIWFEIHQQLSDSLSLKLAQMSMVLWGWILLTVTGTLIMETCLKMDPWFLISQPELVLLLLMLAS